MQNIEPVILLLTALLVFFTCALFAAEHFFNSDSQLFQVLSGLLTAISGALLMRVKPREPADPKTSTTVETTQKIDHPPVVIKTTETHTEPTP